MKEFMQSMLLLIRIVLAWALFMPEVHFKLLFSTSNAHCIVTHNKDLAIMFMPEYLHFLTASTDVADGRSDLPSVQSLLC